MIYNKIEVINMSRGLKNRTPISNAVDTSLFDQLKQFSKEYIIPKSRILDKSIELVLQEYKKPTK